MRDEQKTEALWTYKQTAEFLGFNLSTMYAYVCRKRIPHIRISGRAIRFSPTEIRKWVEDKKVEVSP